MTYYTTNRAVGVLLTSGRRMRSTDRSVQLWTLPVHRGEKDRKLSALCSVSGSTLTCGHKLWVMTDRATAQIQADEAQFLCGVARFSLRDKLLGRLPKEVSRAWLTIRKPRGRPRTL